MTEHKNAKFDELTRPQHFYATFHMEHAYVMAIDAGRFNLTKKYLKGEDPNNDDES